MRTVDLIQRKRGGEELSPEEIEFLVNGYNNGDIPDYQMSAFLMAVYFSGMTDREVSRLTECMLAIYNWPGTYPAPNFDMVVWWWYGWFDPGQTMNALMTSQIGNLNEPYWSNAEYDTLGGQQVAAPDPQKRQSIVWQMQQLMYQQSPWIPLTYPDTLEAWNTAKWTGWTRQFGGTGGVWELEGNIASYLNLRLGVALIWLCQARR